VKRARRDIDTARKLVANGEFDWALAVAYNAMQLTGRAIMTERGYRPSSTRSHVAVVSFLKATLRTGAEDRMTLMMNGTRKKRHMVIYEEMDIVSRSEAEQAIKWAEEFVNRINRLIRESKTSSKHNQFSQGP
jgi:uncharacterized protein (UPF0332 family)